MLGGGDPQLVVEAVVPDFGHVVPVVDDTMLDGVVEFKDSLLGLGFLANIDILIVHSDHDVFVFGPADDRRERGLGGILTGQTGLAHT